MRKAVLFVLTAALLGVDGDHSAPAAAMTLLHQGDPARSDRDLILDAVIRDILTNPWLKVVRADYGSPDGKQIALQSLVEDGLCWPGGYHPRVVGYTFVPAPKGPVDEKKPRMIGLRLDKFRPDEKVSGPFDASIEVVIYNAGGVKDGDPSGGCRLFYTVERRGKEWVATCKRIQS
jgi:hypothetical protein